jgi:hypothetical protein
MWKSEYRSAAERDGCAAAIKATCVLVALDLRAKGMQITCPLPLFILTPLRTRGAAGWERPNIYPVPGSRSAAPLPTAGDRPTRRRQLQGGISSTKTLAMTGQGNQAKILSEARIRAALAAVERSRYPCAIASWSC